MIELQWSKLYTGKCLVKKTAQLRLPGSHLIKNSFRRTRSRIQLQRIEMALDLRTVRQSLAMPSAHSLFVVDDDRCSLLRITQCCQNGAFPSGSGTVTLMYRAAYIIGFRYGTTTYCRDMTTDMLCRVPLRFVGYNIYCDIPTNKNRVKKSCVNVVMY